MLLLDAGNTRIASADSDGRSVGPVRAVSAAEFRIPEAGLIAAASVVPALTEKLRRRGNVFLLANEHASAAGLCLAQVDASTLGADRLANAIELVHQGRLPAVTVDFGTAVNCEIVDRSGAFRGGGIAPGRRLMLAALYGGTAQLPDLAAGDVLREEPGTDTATTIAFGVDQGVAGMVRQWLARIAVLLGETPRIVGIGGDAQRYLAAVPGMEYGGGDFTLRGLLHAYRRNR